jgi:hypothetical protein
VGVVALSLTLLSSVACASEYCTKEQYERDHALIADAFTKGTLAKGPKGLRESVLVEEAEWYKMNYPQQIAFMQSFECSMSGGSNKELLYMDVRSLSTGKLLATWTLGALKPAENVPDLTNPGMSESNKDESRNGLTGQSRADFIKAAISGCRSKSGSENFCSCYANALADSFSQKELDQTFATENRQAAIAALQPKMEAAAKRCVTN